MAIGNNIQWELQTIRLEDFEGPLDLLLYLIERSKIDIKDIPIAAITDQYMSYLYRAESFDVEGASSFIVVAAYLMQLKTKMMLPVPKTEEEGDPREELARSLEMYKRVRQVSAMFKEREAQYGGTRGKRPEPLPARITFSNDDIKVKEFIAAYEAVIRRRQWRLEIESKPVPRVVKKERVPIKRVLNSIAGKLKAKGEFVFGQEFDVTAEDKSEVVAAFMAVLELSRMQQVKLKQNKLFGDINVHAVKDEIDLSGAGTGFGEET